MKDGFCSACSLLGCNKGVVFDNGPYRILSGQAYTKDLGQTTVFTVQHWVDMHWRYVATRGTYEEALTLIQ